MKEKNTCMKIILSLSVLLVTAAYGQFNPLWSPQQISNPSTSSDIAYAIAVDTSGVYIAGYDGVPGNQQWHIEKRNLTSGALISGFGSSGVVTSNPSTGADNACAIAVDASGVYVAGWDNAPGNNQWRIEKRDLATGALISAFGSGGVVASNPSSFQDRPQSITVDAGGIYIGGYDVAAAGDYEWRIEKRDLATGALISGFGSGGVITSNISAGSSRSDQVYAIRADASGLYVAGHDAFISASDYRWRIEKRDLTTGTLDASFGTGGVETSNPDTGTDAIYAITVDAGGLFITGAAQNGSDWGWRIEKRNPSTGALDGVFGTGGAVFSSPSSNTDNPYSIISDASGIYVAGYDGVLGAGNYEWRIEKRDRNTGALLCTRISNPSSNNDWAYAITADAGGIYVAGYDGTFPVNAQWRIEKYDLCGGLPVELTRFEGHAEKHEVILEWTTASESLNDYFSVERSPDGKLFETAGTVKGAGSSVITRSYAFTDLLPQSAHQHIISPSYYYRLKQTDYSGHSTYSETISVRTRSDNVDIIRYVLLNNPADGKIMLGPEHKTGYFIIYNMSGKEVRRSLPGQNEMDITALPPGIYLARIMF